METSDEDRKMNGHQHHQDEEQNTPSKRKKGGLITMPFIIANESFQKVASFGMTPNMIMYLTKDYHMSLVKGSNLLYLWNTANSIFGILGALVADSFVGRFLSIAFGSVFCFLGIFLLWLTTVLPHAKPPPCNPATKNCKPASGGQYALLVFAFLLISIGSGGVSPSQAFGADQVDQREMDSPKNRKILETFFGWYYATACLSVILALTVIVYIQDHFGWRIGFGIPAILMFLSAFFFFVASPLYVKIKVKKSLFTSFAQVVVATYKNRKFQLPTRVSDAQYYYNKDSSYTVPSNKLRFLNKACIIRDPNQDIGPDGLARNPWRLCTVEEVEQLKVLIRVLPIWSSGIMMSINTSQNSFPLLIARTMDRHLGKKFEIPAASFGTFTVLVIVIWIPLYDRVIIPLASKIRGKPVHIGVKVRMGIGLFCTAFGMLLAGIVEHIRRQRAHTEGLADNGDGLVHMSAAWLLLHQLFSGLAESFNAIGQTEFYYSEFPKTMSSVATCLFGIGMAVAGALASVIFNVVDGVTKRGGKEGWLADNVNKGHYDYYYWLLATLSFLNVLYYIFVSWLYGPVAAKRNKESDEKEKIQVEEELAMLRNTSRQEKGDFNLKEDLGLSKPKDLQA